MSKELGTAGIVPDIKQKVCQEMLSSFTTIYCLQWGSVQNLKIWPDISPSSQVPNIVALPAGSTSTTLWSSRTSTLVKNLMPKELVIENMVRWQQRSKSKRDYVKKKKMCKDKRQPSSLPSLHTLLQHTRWRCTGSGPSGPDANPE
jgi:hypothetical protein